MERGMYGALIVKDETDPVTDKERVFMIDDMKLDAENKFTEPSGFIPRVVETHDGRQGNTLLLNGKEDTVIDMNGGQHGKMAVYKFIQRKIFFTALWKEKNLKLLEQMADY